jgi:hypothetical protein
VAEGRDDFGDDKDEDVDAKGKEYLGIYQCRN